MNSGYYCDEHITRFQGECLGYHYVCDGTLEGPVITGTSERSYLLITCVTQGPLMYVTEVGNIISYKSGHLNRAYLDAHYIVELF